MAEPIDPIEFGAYWLLEPLATGERSELFVAAPDAADRANERLALKRLQARFTREPAEVELFLREAKLLAQLAHPNIVGVRELGHHDGQLFMAMEYVEGRDLGQLVRARRHLPPAVAAYVGSRVCSALAYAHSAVDLAGTPLQLVHCNVTPDNVLLDRQGEVRLIDFGEARTTAMMNPTRRGKAPYPPELAGMQLDYRADLYALGTLLYELTTGVKPMADPLAPTKLDPKFPPELARAIMRALASGFGSALEMQAALDLFLRSSDEEITEETIAAALDGREAQANGQAPTDIGDGNVETRIAAAQALSEPQKTVIQMAPDDPEAQQSTNLVPSLASAAEDAPAEKTCIVSAPATPAAAVRPSQPQIPVLTPQSSAKPPVRPTNPPPDPQWDEVTPVGKNPSNSVNAPAAAPAPAPAPAATAAPSRGRGGRIFGAFLKGAVLGGLILAAAFIGRVGTIAEIRLAMSGDQTATSEPGADDPGEPAAFQEGADSAEPAAVATTDAATADDVGQPPAAAAEAAPDASSEADVVATPATAPAVDADAVAERGFGLIVVKGRGKVFIDDKACTAPCAVKVASGEHVISGKGNRPFAKKVTVAANGQATFKVP